MIHPFKFDAILNHHDVTIHATCSELVCQSRSQCEDLTAASWALALYYVRGQLSSRSTQASAECRSASVRARLGRAPAWALVRVTLTPAMPGPALLGIAGTAESDGSIQTDDIIRVPANSDCRRGHEDALPVRTEIIRELSARGPRWATISHPHVHVHWQRSILVRTRSVALIAKGLVLEQRS